MKKKNISSDEYSLRANQIIVKHDQIERGIYGKYENENKLTFVNYKKKSLNLQKEKDQ